MKKIILKVTSSGKVINQENKWNLKILKNLRLAAARNIKLCFSMIKSSNKWNRLTLSYLKRLLSRDAATSFKNHYSSTNKISNLEIYKEELSIKREVSQVIKESKCIKPANIFNKIVTVLNVRGFVPRQDSYKEYRTSASLHTLLEIKSPDNRNLSLRLLREIKIVKMSGILLPKGQNTVNNNYMNKEIQTSFQMQLLKDTNTRLKVLQVTKVLRQGGIVPRKDPAIQYYKYLNQSTQIINRLNKYQFATVSKENISSYRTALNPKFSYQMKLLNNINAGLKEVKTLQVLREVYPIKEEELPIIMGTRIRNLLKVIEVFRQGEIVSRKDPVIPYYKYLNQSTQIINQLNKYNYENVSKENISSYRTAINPKSLYQMKLMNNINAGLKEVKTLQVLREVFPIKEEELLIIKGTRIRNPLNIIEVIRQRRIASCKNPATLHRTHINFQSNFEKGKIAGKIYRNINNEIKLEHYKLKESSFANKSDMQVITRRPANLNRTSDSGAHKETIINDLKKYVEENVEQALKTKSLFNIDYMTDKISREINKRQRIERERRGIY